MLDIDRRLMILFSFTVKLVSEIMRASWGSLCVFPMVLPIDVIASGGMLFTAFSHVTAITWLEMSATCRRHVGDMPKCRLISSQVGNVGDMVFRVSAHFCVAISRH